MIWSMRMLLVAFCSLGLANVWSVAAGEKEPVQDGKTLSEWIVRLKENNQRSAALTALAKMGPAAGKAVPALVEVLENTSAFDGDTQPRVLFALKSIGPQAKAAVPALLRLPVEIALPVLIEIGPDAANQAAPFLRKELKSDSEFTRQRVAYALGWVALPTDETVEALQRALKDSHKEVRLAAVWSLGRLGPKAQEAVPALRKFLKNGGEITLTAATTLVRIDPTQAKDCVAVLLKDQAIMGNPERLKYLPRILAHMTPASPEALAVLIDMLTDDENYAEEIRNLALEELSLLGPKVVPALIEDRKKEAKTERYLCLEALRRIGAGAREALPILQGELEKAKDARTRAELALALVRIAPTQTKEAMKTLLAQLESDKDTNQDTILRVLGEIGPAAKEAIPVLVKHAEGNANHRRKAAALLALARIDPSRLKESVARLTDLVRGRSSDAARALGLLGPPAISALKVLEESMGDNSQRELWHTSLLAIIRIDASQSRALHSGWGTNACGMVGYNRTLDPKQFCAAFRGLAPEVHKEALPLLLYHAPDPRYQHEALVLALEEFAPEARAVFPVLRQMQQSSNEKIRLSVAHVLAKIAP